MPISNELHDLVGNPVPSGDLSSRARERATEIKRRRLAGITTSVVAVAVLAVPSVILARGTGEVTGAPGSGSSSAKPAVSAQPSDSAEQAAKRAALASLNGGSFVKPATVNVVDGPLTAADKIRVDQAQTLLGAGFHNDGGQLEVDATTGVRVGLVATFVASAGGGTVGIAWEPAVIEHSAEAAKSPADGGGEIKSGEAGTSDGKADAVNAQVEGVEVSSDTMHVTMKVVQGSPGSAPILPGKAADAVAHALLASE